MFFLGNKLREFRNQIVQSTLSSETRMKDEILNVIDKEFRDLEKRCDENIVEVTNWLSDIYKIQNTMLNEIKEMKIIFDEVEELKEQKKLPVAKTTVKKQQTKKIKNTAQKS